VDAFAAHARSNGGVVHQPGVMPDVNAPVDAASVGPAGRVSYDAGNTLSVASPQWHVQTAQDNFEATSRTDASAGGNDRSVDITRYIDRNVGGRTGVRIVNGYTTGLNQSWNAHHFRGRAVQFVQRDLSKDGGSVGRTNFAESLRLGVDQQLSVMPSLEDIYRSIANRT
jgi:hypothetical protein